MAVRVFFVFSVIGGWQCGFQLTLKRSLISVKTRRGILWGFLPLLTSFCIFPAFNSLEFPGSCLLWVKKKLFTHSALG